MTRRFNRLSGYYPLADGHLLRWSVLTLNWLPANTICPLFPGEMLTCAVCRVLAMLGMIGEQSVGTSHSMFGADANAVEHNCWGCGGCDEKISQLKSDGGSQR